MIRASSFMHLFINIDSMCLTGFCPLSQSQKAEGESYFLGKAREESNLCFPFSSVT